LPSTSAKHVLAGDVGGTKTLLGLFEVAGARPRLVAEARYDTSAATSLDAIALAFLHGSGASTITAAAFGVAGPVEDGRAQLTNHPWSFDATHIGSRLAAPVRLLNDLEALAYGLDTLEPTDVAAVQEGRPRASGLAAVLGVGTGLGAAYLARHGTGGVACPTESGHADFAPRTSREDQLVAMLRRDYGRATVEHVVSGRGLVNLHRFTHAGQPCAAVASLGEDQWPAAIVNAGQDQRCPGCVDATAMFVSAYGSEAGNVALRSLPFGGLYLGGGVSLALRELLATAAFQEAFVDKPPMRHILAAVPVRLILAPNAALRGAARVAAQLVT
jgi:glucokinase